MRGIFIGLLLVSSPFISTAHSDLHYVQPLIKTAHGFIILQQRFSPQQEKSILEEVIRDKNETAFEDLANNWMMHNILQEKIDKIEQVVQCCHFPYAYYVLGDVLFDSNNQEENSDVKTHLAIYNYLKAYEGGVNLPKMKLLDYFESEKKFPKADDYFQQYCMNK